MSLYTRHLSTLFHAASFSTAQTHSALESTTFSPNWQALTYLFAAMAIASTLVAIALWRQLWRIARDNTLCMTLLSMLPDLVIRMKRDGTLVAVRAGHQFPFPHPKIGQNLRDFLPETAVKQQIELIEQAIATGETLTSKYSSEVDGKTCWQASRVSACTDHEVLMILQDTTAYQQMMEELRQQTEQLQAILSAIPDLMFQLRSDGIYLGYVRPNHLTDLLPEDFNPVGQKVTEYLPADHAQRNLDYLRRALDTGEVQIYKQDVDINGRIQHEEVRVVASGRDRVLFMVRDVSPYRRSEVERDRTAKQLQQQLNRVLLLEQITHEIRSHLDRQEIFTTASLQIGRAFRVNRCLIHTYVEKSLPTIQLAAQYYEIGYEPLNTLEVPVIGNAHIEAILAEDRAIASNDVEKEPLLATMRETGELQLKSMLAVRTSYQYQPNGVIVLHQCDCHRVWTRDEVTLLEAVAAQVGIALCHARLLEQEQAHREELQQKSRELEQLTREAQAANRAKSAFLANMSHELRTPLNAILGFVQVMQLDSSLLKETQDFLQIILQSGEHLLQLINTVLDLSKVDSGRLSLQRQEFNLSDLVDQIQMMFQPQMECKEMQFTVTLAENLPECISTDEAKLRQVLINLMGNAIKFTEQGAVHIRVSVMPQSLVCATQRPPEASSLSPELPPDPFFQEHIDPFRSPAHPFVLSDEEQVEYLRIEIEDTGRGIEAQDLDRVFEAFAQTEVGQMLPDGTGLGLTISQRFIELMGGAIWVHSQPNMGSIFGFEIPVVLKS